MAFSNMFLNVRLLSKFIFVEPMIWKLKFDTFFYNDNNYKHKLFSTKYSAIYTPSNNLWVTLFCFISSTWVIWNSEEHLKKKKTNTKTLENYASQKGSTCYIDLYSLSL